MVISEREKFAVVSSNGESEGSVIKITFYLVKCRGKCAKY